MGSMKNWKQVLNSGFFVCASSGKRSEVGGCDLPETSDVCNVTTMGPGCECEGVESEIGSAAADGFS